MADSPLSDDSLSSVGASTEPLPASEDAAFPASSLPPLTPSAAGDGEDNMDDDDDDEGDGDRLAAGGRRGRRRESASLGTSPADDDDENVGDSEVAAMRLGGDEERRGGADDREDNDSDSSLTGLSSSDGENDRENKRGNGNVKGGGKKWKRKQQVPLTTSDDEELSELSGEGEADPEATPRITGGGLKRPRNSTSGDDDDGFSGDADEDEPSDDDEDDEALSSRKRKRPLSNIPSTNGGVSSNSAASPPRPRTAQSPSLSLSDLEEEDKTRQQQQKQKADISGSSDEEDEPVVAVKPVGRGRGGRGGKRGRGGRGRGRGGAKRGGAAGISAPTKERTGSISDDALSNLSDDEDLKTAVPPPSTFEDSQETPKVEEPEEVDVESSKEEEPVTPVEVEAPVSLPAPTGRGRGGRGRGRGRGRGAWRGKQAAVASPVPQRARSRSTSTDSQTDTTPAPTPRPDLGTSSFSAAAAAAIEAEADALNAEAEATDKTAEAEQSALDILADMTGQQETSLGQLGAAVALGLAENEAEDEDHSNEMDVDHEREHDDEDEEDEEEVPLKKKLSLAIPKKLGKGKERAADQDQVVGGEEEDEPEAATPVGSDHEHEGEDDTSDDASVRKRAEAMEALTRIEIEFARLRDKLYVERMAEVEKERIAVETGSHPELLHLTNLIELRRGKRLELAKKWLEGLEASYDRILDADQHTIWQWWANGRADLRSTMLDEANSKRRKLDREKRNMDRPKDAGLTPVLAPRPLPTVPLEHRRRVGFESDPMAEGEMSWAIMHPDVRVDASVSSLDSESAWADLERMGLREHLRHPGPFGFDPAYNHLTGHLPPNFADPRAPGPFPYGPPGMDPNLAMQHHFGQPQPPLPAAPRADFHSRELNPPRPPSNPRSSNLAKESFGGHARSSSAQNGMRGYPGAHFGGTYGDEVDRLQWGKPAQAGPTQYQFDEGRRRTESNPGGGLAESLDIVAEHYPRKSQEDSVKAADGGANGKTRPSLDDHMATTRSPKAAHKVHSGDLSRNTPSFMSIPAYGHSAAQPPVLPQAASGPTMFNSAQFAELGAQRAG